MTAYPEDLVDADLPERCRARLNEAMSTRDRVRAAAVDAADALKSAAAARDALVLRASKEGGVHAGESLAAHRAVADAEAGLLFAREALDAAEAEITAAQRALDAASGEAHRPVLERAIKMRIAAAAELDRTMLAADEARAAYDAAGEMAVLAQLRGARYPGAPILDRGPYGKRPGEHEQAERAAWGRPAR